ncbi:BTAD domain-containing putative transcriptional regulator [Streptacidiphilus sp. P02-A3a]|uniref:AfsR/SARP family transcriptional regulator n=1 Tax=Streptacidiphilus sp. P02-A3a TaxID=2704468 RepID=UPI0015FC2D91|nr:BTAD domain-containing putative transcriptional regulator [Streptacidiphilus sp. P02-A3a]QMU72703.1 AfsR family transcriptional regulator [Streptacidiphilus sp. P02-A3a]
MRIRLLGPLVVGDPDGATVKLAGTRVRVLLTALALEAGQPVSAARLIDTLWPREQPANPANALQALASRLRGALGRELVAATATGYQLALDPDQVDVHRFEALLRQPGPAVERLSAALALWRGPALADVPGFADAAARLEARRETAREDLLEARLDAAEADPGPLLAELHACTAEAPLRDRPRALLIRALHRAGRGAEALAVYEQGRVLLAEELGMDPSPLLRRAHRTALGPAPESTPPESTPPESRAPESRAPESPAAGRPTPESPASGAAPAAPRALPAPLTSFLGREDELAAVQAELNAVRLVTLTGPGGAGKTRLALEAAGRSGAADVRLVELAPVGGPADVPSAVLAALHLRAAVSAQRPTGIPHPVAEIPERIVAALGNRPLLLVLDNCEHVVEAAAVLTARLLADCPGLRVLATSREPLGITGEQLHPVPPLGFPDVAYEEQRLTVDQAFGFAAVRLFADRAAAVRPGWALTEPDLPPVLRICRTLDGQPLAIELAAARMRSLSPEQIDQRLARRFHLLTSGSRTVLPRHRTLRAVVDWSWDLLEKPERDLLARMSVFAGSASLETVEQVCATAQSPAEEVLEVLSSLVDKSLVTRTGAGRYRLLETIRAYALERLEASGATVAARDAHAAHFLAFAEEGEPRLYTGEQLVWFPRFLVEHDNLIAALRWAVEHGDAVTAQRLIAAVSWYLWRRGERGENLELANAALAMPSDGTPPLARAVAYGITALYSLDTTWDLPESLRLMHIGIDLRDQLGDPFAHPILPMLDIMAALFESRDENVEQLAARLFDAPDPFVRATAHLFMGFSRQNSGRAAEAESYMHEAAARFRAVGDLWGQSFCAAGLADYAQWRGDLEEAMRLWRLAISFEDQLGISGESADYRSRMIHTTGLLGGYDEQTIRTLEDEVETARREGSWMTVLATHTSLADAYRHTGAPERSRPLLRQAWGPVEQRIGGAPQVQALLLSALGYVEAACGDLEAAAEQHRTALSAAAAAHDGPIIADCLQGWADLVLRRGDPVRAAELLGAAHLRRGMPDLSSPDVRRVSAGAEAALGPAEYARAYERGRTTPSEETLSALGVGPESLSGPSPWAAAATTDQLRRW